MIHLKRRVYTPPLSQRVKPGDTLLWYCEEAYLDRNYYVGVAVRRSPDVQGWDVDIIYPNEYHGTFVDYLIVEILNDQ